MRGALLILLAMQTPSLWAKPGLGSTGVGVKFGLLYGCLGSSGFTLVSPISRKVSWDLSFMNSDLDRSSRLGGSSTGDETGTADLEIDEDKIVKASQSRRLLHTQVRWYPYAGSFNVALGLAAARVEAELEAVDGSEVLTEDHTVDYGASSLSLGQMWSGPGWFFGIDYYGFMSPLGRRSEVNRSVEVPQSESLRLISERFSSASHFCAEVGGSILLTFSGGIAF